MKDGNPHGRTAWLGALLHKALLQTVRDPIGLALTVGTPALFVLLAWFVLDADSARPLLLVVTDDPAMRDLLGAPDLPVRVRFAASELALGTRLLELGDGIGAVLEVGRPPRVLDALAPPGAQFLVEGLLARIGEATPSAAGTSSDPFGSYVPGLLVFAVILLVFSTSMSVAREIGHGAMLRVRIAGVPPLTVLGATSLVQLGLGVGTVTTTLALAAVLGFENAGAWGWVFALATLGCVSSVGIGTLVGSLCTSVQHAFLGSSVVMFLLVLFSGVVFPRPQITWFELGTRGVGPFDLLPTTHLHVGLGKITRLGADGPSITFELVALGIAGVTTFAFGLIAFGQRHRRVGTDT